MLKNPNQHLDTYPSFMREMEHHDFETAVERLKTRETVREMMHWMEQSFPAVVKALNLYYIFKGFGSGVQKLHRSRHLTLLA